MRAKEPKPFVDESSGSSTRVVVLNVECGTLHVVSVVIVAAARVFADAFLANSKRQFKCVNEQNVHQELVDLQIVNWTSIEFRVFWASTSQRCHNARQVHWS